MTNHVVAMHRILPEHRHRSPCDCARMRAATHETFLASGEKPKGLASGEKRGRSVASRFAPALGPAPLKRRAPLGHRECAARAAAPTRGAARAPPRRGQLSLGRSTEARACRVGSKKGWSTGAALRRCHRYVHPKRSPQLESVDAGVFDWSPPRHAPAHNNSFARPLKLACESMRFVAEDHALTE